jgi:glycosyltransferase involved in cell wall biosynthesis
VTRTIWVDVEDLFEYSRQNPRPSGIQRVEYELCRALAELAPDRGSVQFVRHDGPRRSFSTIDWMEVERLFSELAASEVEAAPARLPVPVPAPAPATTRRHALRRLFYRAPPGLRQPFSQFIWHQLHAFRFLAATVVNLGYGVRARLRLRSSAEALPTPIVASAIGTAEPVFTAERDFEAEAAPGDVLFVPGSPWFHPDYGSLLRRCKESKGLELALLVYDIIPILRPEWCDRALVLAFTRWMDDVLPLCDTILTISDSSARDLAAYALRRGLTLPRAPAAIPMGTGFTKFSMVRQAVQPATVRRALPPPGSYALAVSTLEARKNHVLLFRVWRRLTEELPRAAVPTLVFAGRVGWLVSDLVQQLRNCDYLDGKILLFEDPSDRELELLYRGCRFTLFASLYEGWGLPVTESLGFGQPCIISDAASLPEAGGSLARYFDPENLADAYHVIREVIENPDELRAWRERVVRDFVPVPWSDSAREVMRVLDQDEGVAGTRVEVAPAPAE